MDETAWRDTVHRLGIIVGGRRRVLAACFAAIAIAASLRMLAPAAPPTVSVWAAARDLSGGRPLAAADIRRLPLPLGDVPAGALRAGAQVVGRLLAGPVRRGEPLTHVRLLEPSLLAALPDPGLVAVPVRIGDGSAAAALAHPGDLVDVLAVADPAAGGPDLSRTVAARLQVLAVPAPSDDSGSDGAGLIVV